MEKSRGQMAEGSVSLVRKPGLLLKWWEPRKGCKQGQDTGSLCCREVSLAG